MSAQARLLLIQIVTHHVLYENDNPAFRIFTWNLKFKVHASMDLERFLAMDDPLTHVHCASIIENDIDSVACGCSQLGRRKTHLCCDFNLVLNICIVITSRYCLLIMVCVISLYLSECTRPNKKSSFSGTACKKKVPFQVLQGSRCELDKCRAFLGVVLPNLGECECYPACALTQDFGRVICDFQYGPLEEDIDFTVLNCDLDSQHWRYDGQSK